MPEPRSRHAPPPVLPDDGSVQVPWPVHPETADLPASTRGAVIIPAHDEAAVIARTLRSLETLTRIDGIEIIVVCNGCSDDTAQIARSFDGVRVEEIERGSKPLALNLGDQVASRWPRLYLDADIEVPPSTVLAVFAALEEPGVLAARPRYAYDTSEGSRPVRAYYRARSRIPAPPLRLWGAGGYAVTQAGHARFETFPNVTADDSWFDAQFRDEEKRVVASPPLRVRTPVTVGDLLAILARQRRGYVELDIPSEAGPRIRSLLTTIRRPRDAWDLLWYGLLSVQARRRAARALGRRGARPWERDASSRSTSKET